jgi:hypothetical protein
MNNKVQDILASGVGTIHDVTSEEFLSSWALLSLTISCLFLHIVGLSHLKVQNEHKFHILIHRSHTGIKVAVKKTHTYEWHERFLDGHASVSDGFGLWTTVNFDE